MRKQSITIASILFAFVANTIAACATGTPQHPLDLLRQIKIESQTKLNLGAKLPDGSDFCIWRGRTCTLKLGSFGGAQMMFLNVDQSGLIEQFHFYYGLVDSDRVHEQVGEFTTLLGKPAVDSTVKLGAYEIREVGWDDGITSYDLLFKTDGANIEESSVLSDNKLARRAH
jgi:hypothetical protein